MKLAVLYDIHGNQPALEAVLAEVRRSGADHVVVGGDVVAGPMPAQCLRMLRSLEMPLTCIRGNGERVVLGARQGGEISSEVPAAFHEVIRWNAAEIDDDLAQWIGEWPPTARVRVPTLGDVLFCHATPRNDLDIFTRETPAERLAPIFATVDAALVVCGHTHMQFDRLVGDVRVVNAGSVGMPFQSPGAYWLDIDDQPRLRQTAYDREAAAAQIRATAYPQAEYFAARHVLSAPEERAMMDAFKQSELRS